MSKPLFWFCIGLVAGSLVTLQVSAIWIAAIGIILATAILAERFNLGKRHGVRYVKPLPRRAARAKK